MSLSRLKKKKKKEGLLATNARWEEWALIKGRFPELFLQSVYQKCTS